MSIEDLKADLAANLKEAHTLGSGLATAVDIANHLKNFLWPFIENVVSELEDLDEGLGDLYHGAEDILQPETGALFATVVAGATGLIGELEKRLTPADAKILAGIKEWRRLAKETEAVLQEIVVTPAEGEDEEEDDEDDDGDDEEDDEDEVTKTKEQA